MSADEIDGDLAQQCEIADSGAVSDLAIVLAESDVEDPVEAVLDAPVLADDLGQDFRRVGAARQEVADLALDLARAVDGADAVNRHDRPQSWPVEQRFQPGGLWAGE